MIKKIFIYFLGGIIILVCIVAFGGIRKNIKVIRPIFSIVQSDSSNTPTIALGMNQDYYYFLNVSQSLDSMKRGGSEEYLMKADTSYIERIEYSSENDLIRSIMPYYWSKVTVSVTSIGITLKKNL